MYVYISLFLSLYLSISISLFLSYKLVECLAVCTKQMGKNLKVVVWAEFSTLS